MLEIRPNCEWCDKDLPPDSNEARIFNYECTYCSECAETVLHNVCATFGGGFAQRPIRPIITAVARKLVTIANALCSSRQK